MASPEEEVAILENMQAAVACDPRERTICLYIQAPFYRFRGELFVERQSCNGLRLWAQNFACVLALAPVLDGPPPEGWDKAFPGTGPLERVEAHLLPVTHRPVAFLRALPSAARMIRNCIARARYLVFAIGGLIGDWGAVSCMIARSNGKPYAVWTDQVMSEVVRRLAAEERPGRRWRARLRALAMDRLERHVVRGATLGLFHGRDTFEHYAPISTNPHVVHNIHIKRADQLDSASLAQKIARVQGGEPLEICYVGRAEPKKGPMDWLAALDALRADDVAFRARWMGDGALLEGMTRFIAAQGLQDLVRLEGFVGDHAQVLEALRAADLMLFCHKTPESPRCLIEALISGTPIVGYESAYARDLTDRHGGAVLTSLNDPSALAQAVARLAKDRTLLADLIAKAARDGAAFDDETVFRERSELIKHYL